MLCRLILCPAPLHLSFLCVLLNLSTHFCASSVWADVHASECCSPTRRREALRNKWHGSVQEEIVFEYWIAWKSFVFFNFCAKDTLFLLDFLHQQVHVVLLLLQHLLQSVDLSLVFQEFPLKTMIFLLQNLTNGLYSGRQSAHYQRRITNIHLGVLCLCTVTSPCFPPNCRMDLVGRPNTGRVSQHHWGAKTFKSSAETKSGEFKCFITPTNTCSGCPSLMSSSEETPAARSAAALETPCHSCLWTSAWEAGLDQSWGTALLAATQ